LQGCTIPINYNSNEPNQHLAGQQIAGTFACHKFDIKLLLMNCRMLMEVVISIPPPDGGRTVKPMCVKSQK